MKKIKTEPLNSKIKKRNPRKNDCPFNVYLFIDV
jgi:hypothetical protein